MEPLTDNSITNIFIVLYGIEFEIHENSLFINEMHKMNFKSDISGIDSYEKIISKIETPDVVHQNFIKKLARYHFQVKAIIQDILECRESMEALSELNEKGRAKINLLRDEIESMELYGKECSDPKYSIELDTQKRQLAILLREFKDANITSMFAIERAQREELLKSPEGDDSSLRNRKKKVDRDALLEKSSGVTEQLLSISRQLADTTQRSQNTLDSLVSSSSTVHGTQSELQNTAGSISQSSKLLKKYGRREFTDKIIMFFAFLFFLAVCLYIVQKRLF